MNTKKIQGQYTDSELQSMYQERVNDFNRSNKHVKNHVVLKFGNSTFNYYTQHSDGSWTNYDCKTKY